MWNEFINKLFNKILQKDFDILLEQIINIF